MRRTGSFMLLAFISDYSYYIILLIMDLRIFQASKISLFNLLNTDYTTYTLFIIISDPLRVLLKLIKPYLIFVILPLMEAGVARGCYDHFSFSNRENLKHDRLDINLIIDRGSIWSNPSYVLGIGSPPKKYKELNYYYTLSPL